MARKLFKDFVQEIPKELIYELYITKNKSVKECTALLNIGQTMFMRLIKYYGVKKPKDLHTQNIKNSKLEKYGDENYNNHAQSIQTNLQKYGVKNQFQRKDLFPHIYQVKLNKYGSYNNMSKNMATREANFGSKEASYKHQAETYKQTCLVKYGVTNAAKLQEVRDQIADSLQETFLERYGVENYWSLPNAVRSHGSTDSKANVAFSQLLSSQQISYKREFALGGKIFDFKVGKILIEINPTPTHNSTWGIYSAQGIGKNYHKEKSATAEQNNYQCIHVFDWEDIDIIINLLHQRKSIYARKCDVKEISAVEASEFLNHYHLQGYAKDKVRLGLFFENSLVAVMTFGKPRYNQHYQYELIRYCSPNYHIIGGEEKLFKFFVNAYSPLSIISYCDLSKFVGKIYNKLGFRCLRKSAPAKHWYNLKTKEHYTDNFIRQRGYDQIFHTSFGKGISNDVLMLEAGFVEVYDCGQATYVWKA